ncbi:hypothetical protein PITCH_A410019 [uncultured Desulfobacterium sp.]|uniref:Uncharacterized protein n=1 Tax=uncultured Desulfobacterium sp. TaxID=201089 RepID=A0A445MZW5_9BACT|nr:hypothetical protein PITCH_A410019 [uncultured Desulfobacterium sp.]
MFGGMSPEVSAETRMIGYLSYSVIFSEKQGGFPPCFSEISWQL